MHYVKLNCCLKPPVLGITWLKYYQITVTLFTLEHQFLYISFIQKKQGTECFGGIQAV